LSSKDLYLPCEGVQTQSKVRYAVSNARTTQQTRNASD